MYKHNYSDDYEHDQISKEKCSDLLTHTINFVSWPIIKP